MAEAGRRDFVAGGGGDGARDDDGRGRAGGADRSM
jgi:hypothetical protein